MSVHAIVARARFQGGAIVVALALLAATGCIREGSGSAAEAEDPHSGTGAHETASTGSAVEPRAGGTKGTRRESSGSGTFEFRAGVLVDADRGVCYLMNTDDGIDAVVLSSGRVLWTTTVAQKPLLLVASTIVAHAESEDRGNVLRLVLLDAAKSGAVKARADVDLPEGVRASIDDGPGRAFRVETWLEANRVMVAWSYAEAPVRGAEMISETTSQARRYEGAARLDPKTGKVMAVSEGERRSAPTPPLPSNLSQLKESGRLPGPLWRAGETYAAVSRGAKRTVLKRWRAATGDALPDVTLFTESYTVRYPSADTRHVLVSRRDPTRPAEQSYEWLIFSLATGARIAELRRSLPAAWFFVTGPLLVHEVQRQAQLVDGAWTEEPRKVRAIDLETGAERWTRPLRDTAFRGTLPPGAPGLQGSREPPGSSDAVQPTEGE